VEIAEPAPLPAPPPAITPDFTGNQGYLGPATDGIDAIFSATIPGGNGNGIKIYDVEYSWNQTHEDLSKANGVLLLLNAGDSSHDPFSNNNHGTAVLGELIADNNTKGVTGISSAANIGLAPAYTLNLGYNPANAILLAVADGFPGDVILIEQQIIVCGLPEDSYGPLEWIPSVFDAIQTAVANGFVVVEAAGNGSVNLDQAACGTAFDRTMHDSGAIIVGAGGSPGGLDRQRLSFSSYGSRLDLQGWGDNVMTTGYGNFYRNSNDLTNPNFWYTNTFSGTSSASPIVAGAAANLQGIALNRFGAPLIPVQIREALVETGSPQLGNTAEHIGPRPDLRAAIAEMQPPTPTPCSNPTYDFNHNGKPDYVLYNGGTRQTAVWYINSNVFAGGVYGPTLPVGWNVIDVADFSGDGNLDYALFNPSTRQTAIWYLSGPTFVGGLFGPTLPSGWALVATADFNGDCKPDYVLYNAATRQTAVWYINNNVFAGSAFAPTLPASWRLAGVADFNSDGKRDYLLFNASTRQSAIWYMSNNVFVSGAYGPTIASGYQLQGTADFNGGGKPDYLLFSPSTRRTAIWYLNNNIFIGGAYGPTLP
jgi:hypothetical protein